jgi:hypothetical protein
MDNDVYVVNSLNKYRKFEMVVGWDNWGKGLGNQLLIAHRNARLLKAQFDSYRFVSTMKTFFFLSLFQLKKMHFYKS